VTLEEAVNTPFDVIYRMSSEARNAWMEEAGKAIREAYPSGYAVLKSKNPPKCLQEYQRRIVKVCGPDIHEEGNVRIHVPDCGFCSVQIEDLEPFGVPD
jgi:hypothetical protein